MTREERLKLMRRFVEDYCFPTLAAKGNDYDAEKHGDHLTWAALPNRGTDRYVALWTHMVKQIFAVRTWVDVRKLASEPLESRLMDIINYCLLFVSMLVEDNIIELKPQVVWCPKCFSEYQEGATVCGKTCIWRIECKAERDADLHGGPVAPSNNITAKEKDDGRG